MSCTVPGIKGLITMNYEKVDNDYVINLTLPEGMKAVVYVPEKAVVNINSEVYYQNGKYASDNKTGDVEIIKQ